MLFFLLCLVIFEILLFIFLIIEPLFLSFEIWFDPEIDYSPVTLQFASFAPGSSVADEVFFAEWDGDTWTIGSDAWDITQGLIKAAVFGLVLSVISCEQGYHAKGGAKGVGMATTKAVVYSCVSILMLDYFVSDILFIITEN